MMEKSTIHALIHFSQSENEFSDESIEAAFRVRSKSKALELAQQSFLSTLELKLFTDFDLKGSESIIALQHRLATELLPHDVPDKKNIGPLLEILQENATGPNVASYRYLWCEAKSAALFSRIKSLHTEGKTSGSDLYKVVRESCLSRPSKDALVVDPVALFEHYRL